MSVNNSLNTDPSSVDAGTLLLKLAGKQQKNDDKPVSPKDKPKIAKKGGIAKKDSKSTKDSKDTKKQAASVEFSLPLTLDEIAKGPLSFELNEDDEMDEVSMAAFRDLFNMLDQSNTGIITVDNLYEEIHNLDSEITYNEVEELLKRVDKDGNGEIDFDEFIFHVTSMGKELLGEDGAAIDEDQKRENTRRRSVFYSAITHFSIKQTLADIERKFTKHAPHVLSHYTAGQRLIGLTARQLEREMDRMKKSAATNDSPYAMPLQFVHMGATETVHRRNIKSTVVKKDKQQVTSCRDLSKYKPEINDTGSDDIVDINLEIANTMELFAQHRGSIAPIAQDDWINRIKEKIGKVKMLTDNLDKEIVLPSSSTSMKTLMKYQQSKRRSSSIKRRQIIKRNNLKLGLWWTTPRIQYMKVPLPSMKMKLASTQITFNEQHQIRAKAKVAIDNYYINLRQTEIRNAWDHWDRLYSDVVLPKKQLEKFRTVYSTYSPHREEEAFVLCPWKPGPFRFLRHMPKVSALPNVPDYKMSSRSTRVVRQSNNLIARPLTPLSTASSSQRF